MIETNPEGVIDFAKDKMRNQCNWTAVVSATQAAAQQLQPFVEQRLPSGQLNPPVAIVGAAVLMLTGLSLARWLAPWVALISAAYLGQNFAYSLWLKHVVLIDVMVLAFGFLLRVLAGVFIVQVTNFSPWLYVCVTLLALFLGFGKRRHEITLLTTNAAQHRASLAHYNLPLLDQIIGIVTATTLVAYTFYTFAAKTAVMHDGRMLFTVPFVFYFIVRYLYLIHVENRGGAPDELLLKDRQLLATSLLWMVMTIGLIYVIPASM